MNDDPTRAASPAPELTGASLTGAGLRLVLCPSWQLLCRSVAEQVRVAPEDPFASQLLVTDLAGAQRALSQALATELAPKGAGGICAGVDFTTLRTLRRRLEAELLGIDAATDPWRSRGLALAVLDAMDEAAGQDWFAPVEQHLGDAGQRPGRRLATASRISRLLRGYARRVPQLLQGWNQGGTTAPDGSPLRADELWQPRIWQMVRERLSESDPVSRHQLLLERITDQETPGHADAVRRLAGGYQVVRLVNPTPCAPLDRELVVALSRVVQVVIWQVATDADAPLAGQWGQARARGVERWRQVADRVEVLEAEASPVGLLTAVQVHGSHGPDRQVEVLREVLLGLFADDPTLQPRDVVVACTDLDAYAPLVRASFCLDDQVLGPRLHPGHRLRVQLADASLEQPNQVLEVLRRLLHLAGDRATGQDLVDLCSATPVATRFGLGSESIERITRLVLAGDVRWGLDSRHRAEFGLSQVRQSTWLSGVERVLVGVAMGTQPLRWIGAALPVDQVDSSDVMAAGSLAEVVSRVRKLVAEWREPAPVTRWVERLHEALDLLVATSVDDAWQLTRARGELADLADLTLARTALLGLGDVQALFDQLLRTGRGRPNFGNGSLLVCGLADLADVHHRVVAVLGLDDQRFPARPAADGDDLALRGATDPELDERARSRQLLLDALLAAGETFVVVHQARTARTNEPVPRPVAVIDLLDACARHGSAMVQLHPLQPQSPGNFNAEPDAEPFSFDAAALAGAQAREVAALQGAAGAEPLWQVPLAGPQNESKTLGSAIDVQELIAFYRHPARELLRRSLGVTMGSWQTTLPDELPVEPDALQEWAIGDRMVTLALSGLDAEQVASAERLRGELPPGPLGARTLTRLMPTVGRIVNAVQRVSAARAEDLDCELALADGALLQGRLRVHETSLVSHSFSRTSGASLLTAWTQLLLLAVTRPAPPTGWRAVHVGRDAICTMQAPPAQAAIELLGQMVALRERGLVQLVPLPLRAASGLQRLVPVKPWKPEEPDLLARREFGREWDKDWARFVTEDLEELRRIPPQPGDPGIPGPSRFENLANWLLTPLREQLTPGNLQ